MPNQRMQMRVGTASAPLPNQDSMDVLLFDSTGAPLTVPKLIAARADAAAATSTAAAGATPTKAEFDALRTDYLALRTLVNDLLAKMRTAGILAP